MPSDDDVEHYLGKDSVAAMDKNLAGLQPENESCSTLIGAREVMNMELDS